MKKRPDGDKERRRSRAAGTNPPHSAPPCAVRTSVSDPLVRLVLTLLSVHQSFSPPSRLLSARSSASLAAQLSLLLLLSSSSSGISAARSSCRASDSASPPTPAVGDQPLSCQMMLGVALPPSSRSIQSALFPSAPPTHHLFSHTFMHLTFSFFFNFLGFFLFHNKTLSCSTRRQSLPPLFPFHPHLPSFLSICRLTGRAAHPSCERRFA